MTSYSDNELELRAGDFDREEIADSLRRNHSEGRLDSDEFAARVDRCYDAKTLGELQLLVADLPPEPARRPFVSLERPGIRAAAALAIIFAAVAVAATAAHGGFWIVVPVLFMTRFWLWGRGPGRSSYDSSGSPTLTSPGSSTSP